MFRPHFEILPRPQKALWAELSEVPRQFVLYGGTAVALRLGHRASADFDFFSSEPFSAEDLLHTLSFLKGVRILQNVAQTLSVALERDGPVKLSFFGGLALRRVGEPDTTPDGVLTVASLLDLAGLKAAVLTQRAESKDYLDLLAILNSGVSLSSALAAASAIYGQQYNPLLTLKALTYFGDGDLWKLSDEQKGRLVKLASSEGADLPVFSRRPGGLTPSTRPRTH